MENYIGKICPFCKTEIKAGDTVIVCPSCDIPHHQDCWNENNGCTTFGCTQQNYAAQGTNPTEVCDKCGAPLGDGQAFCPKCGAPKASRQTNCSKCGQPIAPGQDFCTNCGQKVDVILASNVSAAINQFNENIKPEEPQGTNKFALLATIFGAIGVIPFLNFILLVPAIVFAIIGLINIKKFKKGLTIASVIIVAVSVLISMIWVSAALGLGFGTQDFNDMYSHLEGESWCDIASDGSWMEIDTNPYDIDDYYNSTALAKVKSINNELGFSSSVYQEMMETRAIDGRQYAYSDDYSVSWTYHPDTGMEVIYKVID